jgi:diaminopimelate epimerase
MSGNGIRGLAWVASRHGLGNDERLVVDTAAGRRVVTLARASDGSVVAADVDMGAVRIDGRDVCITVHGTEYRGDVADIGNPHFVCFVDDPETVRVTTHGPVIERNERFQPQRTNVEFVRVDGRDELTMRVWERGAGETLSCGTGACAAAAVAHLRGLVDDRVCMHVPGGELDIRVGETVRLGGPVVHVFDMDVEVGS